MKMKRVLSLLLAVVMLCVVTGCSSAPDAGSAAGSAPPAGDGAGADDSFLAGYCQATATTFFDGIFFGLEDAVKEANGTIIRMESRLDLQRELANVEALLSQEIDVLFISCVDANSSAGAVKLANEAGIPVICLGSEPIGDCEYLTLIKSDDVQAAYDIALWAFEKIGNEGEVLIMDGAPVSDVLDRMEGYRQAIEDTPGITLAGEGRVKPEEFSAATVVRITEDLLTAHPDAKVLLGFCGLVVANAPTAMETLGREDLIVVDVDGITDEIDQIKPGGKATHCATMGQYPYEFGQMGVQVFLKYRDDPNAEIEKFTKVDTMLITTENWDQFDGWSKFEGRR